MPIMFLGGASTGAAQTMEGHKMVGIYGIPGVSAPAISKPLNEGAQAKPPAAEKTAQGDEVTFSDTAQQASDIARLMEQVAERDEIRAEQVARAKENIEKGAYRIADVVRVVATRVGAQLELGGQA